MVNVKTVDMQEIPKPKAVNNVRYGHIHGSFIDGGASVLAVHASTRIRKESTAN